MHTRRAKSCELRPFFCAAFCALIALASVTGQNAVAQDLTAAQPSAVLAETTPPALADPDAVAAEPADASATPPSGDCELQPGPVRTVARVLDAETVQLDDGREVRIIGALAPRARDAVANPGEWPAEQEAIAALTELVLGHSVKLAYGGGRRDRYGRHLAQLFVEKDGESQWVQGWMLANGHARFYGLFDNFSCAQELRAQEAQARTQRIGIWSVALYRPKPAANAQISMALRSSYQIVEGRIANVSRTKSAVYLNFGQDWKTDFTIKVAKSTLSANAAWAAGLEGLQGKSIAVRGWIERGNGPLVELINPAQLEVRDEGPPAANTAPVDGPAPDDVPVAETFPQPGSDAPETASVAGVVQEAPAAKDAAGAAVPLASGEPTATDQKPATEPAIIARTARKNSASKKPPGQHLAERKSAAATTAGQKPTAPLRSKPINKKRPELTIPGAVDL